MLLKLEHFGKQIRNTLKVLKFGVGEGWRRSVGPIVWKMKSYIEWSRKCAIYIQYKRKGDWFNHMLLRNCLLKYFIESDIEGKTEGMGRRCRSCKQLLNVFKGTRRCWRLKTEAFDRSFWRNRFGEGCGPDVGETAWWWWWLVMVLVMLHQS